MILLALLVGGRRRKGRPEGPPPVPVVPRRRDQDRQYVYRFVPSKDACTACQSHAAHRTYRTAEAAEGDRAHAECHCDIAPQAAQDPFLMARFKGSDVLDDRDG
jgi:hypothetical protein